MFKLDKYRVKIDIQLDKGLYVFDSEAATGKTRLTKAIKRYMCYDAGVCAYTYNDKQCGIPIENVLVPKKYELIVVDRYDMYRDYGYDLILECAKESIVLVDSKRGAFFNEMNDFCTIEMPEGNSIKVRGYI